PAELIRCFIDAGLPVGVCNLVYGDPAEISEYLIPHPVIRKVTFTGSTPVGKQLAALAGQHMKRVTMELGGHAPAIVFDDADLDLAAKTLAAAKFRNAGQVCVSPTRFLVQEALYEPFVEKFTAYAKGVKVGNGLEQGTQMGPLVHERRIPWVDGLMADARQKGAEVRTGGERIGNKGFFYQPTVLTNVGRDARMMNEEPFAPVAMIASFRDFDEVVEEANRLPYGLASYAFTRSAKTANAIAAKVESGMMTINHLGLALPEVPFGGIKDSGYGSEGGSEAIEAYLNTKFVSQAGL
ncbi:aldehyde dehydrogenase family protein, partial [Paracraurococcus ruber]